MVSGVGHSCVAALLDTPSMESKWYKNELKVVSEVLPALQRGRSVRIGGVFLVYCYRSAGALPVCCWCLAGVLLVSCWRLACVLLVRSWLVYCLCLASVLLVCC